ncbi:MAG: S1/P1 nuclease [Pseudomonadota bacterium]
MKLVAPIIIAIALLAPTSALAWGKTGHRVTGQIADEYLSRKARREITKILGVEDLAEASTWPDFMRSNPDKFWQSDAGPWHYVTVPEGKSYSDSIAPDQGDAVTALNKFRDMLEDQSSTVEDKQLALRFIVHLIGDLHQPLHAGNGIDRGGNDVRVIFFSIPMNLHLVWDEGIIDEHQLSYTEMSDWLLRRITKKKAQEWADTDPTVWIEESIALREGVYPKDSALLQWGYYYEHRDTVRTRLSQAGVRIAAYLNEVFD